MNLIQVLSTASHLVLELAGKTPSKGKPGSTVEEKVREAVRSTITYVDDQWISNRDRQ